MLFGFGETSVQLLFDELGVVCTAVVVTLVVGGVSMPDIRVDRLRGVEMVCSSGVIGLP